MVKKRVFRPGDKVRIVNPLQVERVGYPKTVMMCFNELCESLNENHLEKTFKFNSCKLNQALEILGLPILQNQRERDRVIYGLAQYKLAADGFGGKERSIHYVQHSNEQISNFTHDYLQNRITEVVSKRVVKTGKYFGSSGGRDYDGDYWFEPGGLEDMKTHILITTELGEFEERNLEYVSN